MPPWERYQQTPASDLPPPANPSVAPPGDAPAPAAKTEPVFPRKPWEDFRNPVTREQGIDSVTGAPMDVRLMVESAPEADKLANVQRFYPDAKPYIHDPDVTFVDPNTGTVKTRPGNKYTNYIFTNPETGRLTLLNPPGADRGDLFGIARQSAEFVGGTAGAFIGEAVGGPPGAIAGAGIGSAGGGALFDVGVNTAGRIDTRTTGERVGQAAEDAVFNSLGQYGGHLIGARLKGVFAGEPAAVQGILRAFDNLGITPSADIIGSKTTKNAFKTLELSPLGGEWISNASRQVVEGASQASDNIEAMIGRAKTPQGAGEVVKDATDSALERIPKNYGAIYDNLFQKIGPDSPVALNEVTALRDDMVSRLANAPDSLKSKYGQTIDYLNGIISDAGQYGGNVPFSTFREIRTSVRKKLDNSRLPGEGNEANEAWNDAYDAITRDMSDAAKAADPSAEKSLKVLDTAVAEYSNTTKKTLGKIRKYDADEKAFDFVLQSGMDGGTALKRLRGVFTNDEWDTVAASVFHQLGRAKAGVQGAAGDDFSPATFLTNWSKLAPEGKEALFGGARYAGLRSAMDDLATVAGEIKNSDKFRNFSNTSRATFMMAAFLALEQGASGIVEGNMKKTAIALGSAAIPPIGAKLLSSEKFVRWLATPPATGGKSLPAHFARLGAIVAEDPSIQEPVAQFLRNLSGKQTPATEPPAPQAQ